jgi:glycosyltransferase involved in cell wall biosynthesis
VVAPGLSTPTHPSRPSASARATQRRRVCIVGEDLSGPPDEGLKKFVHQLARTWRREHDLSLVSVSRDLAWSGAERVPGSRTFVSGRLHRALASRKPEVLVYAPRSSTTFMAFVRGRVLRSYCRRARIVMLGLQPRHHSRVERRLIRYLAPDLVCVQTRSSQAYLQRLGCSTMLLPSGVDLHTFRPAPVERRVVLRAQYGLRADQPVVLHVGHLQPGRNLGVLADLAARGTCQVVLVTSSSLEQVPELALSLRRAGVHVWSEYQPSIEQLYQLADVYLFPVLSSDNAIEVPLSVLEAFACDLAVATTRFGGLPLLFETPGSAGLRFVDSPAELVHAAEQLLRSAPAGTRALAAPFGWEQIAATLLERAAGA